MPWLSSKFIEQKNRDQKRKAVNIENTSSSYFLKFTAVLYRGLKQSLKWEDVRPV
jgi:hypothetical protein